METDDAKEQLPKSTSLRSWLHWSAGWRPNAKGGRSVWREISDQIVGQRFASLVRRSQFLVRAKRLAPYSLPVQTITSFAGRRIDMGMGAALPNRITRLGRCPGMPSQSAKAGRNAATSMGMFICA